MNAQNISESCFLEIFNKVTHCDGRLCQHAFHVRNRNQRQPADTDRMIAHSANISFTDHKKFNENQTGNETADVGAIGHPAARTATEHTQ